LLLRYFGHACFSARLAGRDWILDPFASPLFDGRFTYPLPRGDFAFAACSHGHADHCHLGPHLGSPARVEADGEWGGVRVRFLDTWHDEAHGAYQGANRVVVLDAPEGRLVHCGDLGALPGAEVLEQAARPDVLMVPVGGNYTLDADGAWRLVEALRPRVIIPMHYRTPLCTLPLEGPLRFLEREPYRCVPGGEVELGRDGAGPRVVWLGVRGALEY
jgi:L-ascorbate metabolism protein UlaG (beta-lactamase superfamily)